MTAGEGPTFVDLFSGAGGLSLGLKQAGWDPIYAQDYWQDAVDTYRINLSGHTAECGDIHDLDHHRLLKVLPSRPDWIVGGPPCQGYSTVGKRHRGDKRNGLFKQFRRVVADVRPNGFLIENVLGLRDMGFEAEVARTFEELGYSVGWNIVTAADHGVPQLRRRVIFVGHRHGDFKGLDPVLMQDQYVTVGDAIGDLPPLFPGEAADAYTNPPINEYQKRMRKGSRTLQGHSASRHPAHLITAISFIPDGGNRTSIPDQYQPKSGFHNSYSRLASFLPAVAVTQNMGKPSGTRCIHPSQNRGLTTREGARLQSFPDAFHFTGSTTSQRLQVANAVPPLVAEALGRAIGNEDSWS